MTEIPIERKPRSKAGPLVTLLIVAVVVAAVWYWWATRPTAATAPTTGLANPPAPAARVSVASAYSSTESI